MLSLRLERGLLSELDELARSTKRSRTFLVEDALTAYLKQHMWQVRAIEQAVREADAGDFVSEDEISALDRKYRRSK